METGSIVLIKFSGREPQDEFPVEVTLEIVRETDWGLEGHAFLWDAGKYRKSTYIHVVPKTSIRRLVVATPGSDFEKSFKEVQ